LLHHVIGINSINNNKNEFSFGIKCFGSKIILGKAVPGPGTYNIKNLLGSPSIHSTMLPKRPDNTPVYSKNVPGPGTYSPECRKALSSCKYIIYIINKLFIELAQNLEVNLIKNLYYALDQELMILQLDISAIDLHHLTGGNMFSLNVQLECQRIIEEESVMH